MPSILTGSKKYSFLLLFLAIASCQNQDKMQRFQGDALGTSYNVRYFDIAPNQRVSDSIDAVFFTHESIHVNLLAKCHYFKSKPR